MALATILILTPLILAAALVRDRAKTFEANGEAIAPETPLWPWETHAKETQGKDNIGVVALDRAR